MKKKSLILFFTLIICTFFSFQVNAQIQSGDIVLNINPRYPKANESVVASISTFTTDLNNAKISWILDGQTSLEGIGKKDFSFKVGNSGFSTNLEVKIETITGFVINKKITISPSDIDMLWQSYNTYVPPFYRGKALVPMEGQIRVVAIPSTQNLAGFNYQWKLDDKSQPSASGYQKNYFIYKNSYLENDNTVVVTVSDFFGNGIGQGSITIKPSSPKIVFYKKDQILGTQWENSINDGFTINKDGNTIVAEPYFFYPKDFNLTNVSFDWLLNGEKTETQKPINTLSIKPTSGQYGNAVIKVIINNTNTLFESVEKQLNVSF